MNLKNMATINKIYFAIVLYALLALNRIKTIAMPYIDGVKITNIIIIIVVSIIAIMCIKSTRVVARYTILQTICVFLLFLYCLVGMLFSDNLQQSLYALVLMLLPLFFLVFIRGQSEDNFFYILKLLAICSIVYSIIIIISAFHYATLMSIIGNNGNLYSNRTRASLPLGSSITVSYYLNISLPIILLLYLRAASKKEKSRWLIGILLNVFATMIQLSRSAFYTTVLILILFFLFVHKKSDSGKKFRLLVFILIGVIYAFLNFDLNRLTLDFFSNRTGFDAPRYNALDLAWYLFLDNFFLGTGVGRYFFRAWSVSSYLAVDSIVGLIDPHNALLLLLSETGIVGSILYATILFNVLGLIRKIEDKMVRTTAYLVVFAIGINNLSGSQIINEINYASIAFIYLAIFAGRSVTQQRRIRKS